MRSGPPILWVAIALLMAGAPAALGESEHKTDAHGKGAHGKKDKHDAPEHGKEEEAPASPPPPRTACFYNPNGPIKPLLGDKSEHPAAEAAAPPAAEHAEHPSPEAPGAEAKAEHPAAEAAAPPAAEHAEQPSPETPAAAAKAEHPASDAAAPPPAERAEQPSPETPAAEAKAEHPASDAAAPPAAEHAEHPSPEAPPAEAKADHAAAPGSEPPAAEHAAAKDTVQPYMLIRTLEALQDKIATGSRDAHIYQRELITEIAKKLPLVPDENWRQPRNSRAAIVFALSGGGPGVLAKLLSLSPVPCVDDNLIKGLLDYSQGNNKEALALLSKIDARTLDSRAGGHLALAQAILVAADDPKRAMAYLDTARLMAPGTLVEEAALRREAIIAALAGDVDAFKRLTSQYLRRYSESLYAGDFVHRFADAVATGKYAESPALFKELAEVLDTLGKDQEKVAYSAIAGAGIVRGNVQLTLLAAKKLADSAKDDPKRALQARLYESAALLVTDDFDRAVVQLKSIDRAELGPRDQPLLDSALAVAERIHAQEAAAEPPPVSAKQGQNAELSQMPDVVGRANKAIEKVDSLLDGDKR